MKFGTVPLDQAVGAVLAHSVALPGANSGASAGGGRLRKGVLLTSTHVAALAAAGVRDVVVARLGRHDVPEDSAAARIGAALVSNGLRAGHAATGRVNLFAQLPGVIEVSPAVDALNMVDPLIGLATVPRWARVAAGDMVATLKIIAYGVDAASVSAAEQAARGALTLWTPRLTSATLIETATGEADPSDKGREATKARLGRLGVALAPRTIAAHTTDAVAAALRAAASDLILILTASATSDAMDVAPAALIAAGGRLERFGMPVDPGNLLFLGDIDGKPVVGLPGCARSPALNGADWVLERLICGVPVTGPDIAAMGRGGLLKEVSARGRLREG